MFCTFSVKPFFGFLAASLMGISFAAPAALANPLSKFDSAFDNPTCNKVPVTDILESERKEKQNDSGSTAQSTKNEQHQENSHSSKKSGSAGIWILKGRGESSSTSSNKTDSLFEDNFESDWNQDQEFFEILKKIENRDDIYITNCDSFNEAAAKSNTSLFAAIAQTETAKTQADRDVNIAGINADMKKNINYEQQQTHRLAIKTSADVKISEINMKGNLGLMQFYSYLNLQQPQGEQE